MERSGRLDRGDGVELAWALREGRGPTIVFLPGYNSDMQGSKATALDAWCAARGRAMLRLDYSGHGASGGRFEDGTIGRWTEDARLVIKSVAPAGPLLLVGSSMGGWIGLLLARALGARIAALVGIAAAPDFTETFWNRMSPEEQAEMRAKGHVLRPSDYGDPYLFTHALIEDGRRHLLLGGQIPLACPVRLLQGQRDPDVPWRHALAIAEHLAGDDVAVTLLKDGDHRLSRPQDLALLCRTVGALLGEDGA
jgi:pimeloyl-ACP methyl ester carboxylesterase